MPDLIAIFRAGCTMRWHTNPDLSGTRDRVDGHAGRVARLILALHPAPTWALLAAALIHDDGEAEVGDIRAPAKDAHPDLRDALEAAERNAVARLWQGRDFADPRFLRDGDAEWLQLADRLDAYIWASHHAPHVLTGDGWPEARDRLLAMAAKLGGLALVETVRAAMPHRFQVRDLHPTRKD